MTPARTKPPRKRPLVITERMEAILKAVHFYRYMTALDVAHLLYSPASLTYVGSVLADLAGGEDGQTNNYLYRFRLPSTTTGNTERIYTLGSRGRDFLARDVGMPVEWYFRPHKVKHFSYGAVLHNLLLTRFLVSAHAWVKQRSDYRIADMRICYELAQEPCTVKITVDERLRTVTVIPDGWLYLEMEKGGQTRAFPILLEIDRGTAFQQKFKMHIYTRLELVRGGEYKRIFGTEAVTIAYVTTGSTVEYTDTRIIAMRTWTSEVLKDLNMQSWAPLFRFRALTPKEIYNRPLFDEPVWYTPGTQTPVPLFEL